jgi:hypothetical protein
MSVELPFLATLSKEAYDAYLISQYMMNNPNVSIARAAFQLSKGTWDAARLSAGVAQVTAAMAETGGVGGGFAAIEQVVQHGTTAAAAVEAEAAAAAAASQGVVRRTLTGIGRWILRKITGDAAVSSAAALGTGVVVTTVALGVLTYAGATYIGSRSGDASVLPGARMSQPAATPVTGAAPVEGLKYAVFLLPDNSGGTIYIGQEETLKQLRTCDTPNGGLCDDPNKTYPPVRYEMKSAEFDTAEEALAAACQAGQVKPGYWGQKLAAYGGEYWFEGACPAPAT